jgi:hypothetical protein
LMVDPATAVDLAASLAVSGSRLGLRFDWPG